MSLILLMTVISNGTHGSYYCYAHLLVLRSFPRRAVPYRQKDITAHLYSIINLQTPTENAPLDIYLMVHNATAWNHSNHGAQLMPS